MSETMQSSTIPQISEYLKDSPKNWGKWGPNDEVGALNYLTPDVVLLAVRSVRQGKVFTLQIPMAHPAGDPVWPGSGRTSAQRFMTLDKGHFLAGKGPAFPGGLEGADDYMSTYLQGSTQYDALGHVWFDDELWNGYDAKGTIGGLSQASVYPIATRGVVGRGILLDMARFRGKQELDYGETFSHEDLLACATHQGVEIQKRDILVIRTGIMGRFYRVSREEFGRGFIEPGLLYSPELVTWFQAMEIPNLVTDTFGNEATIQPGHIHALLHGALMRNLGIAFSELAWLEDLATDCAADHQYDFLYTAGPLKVVAAAGAPVNPVVIK